MVTTGSYCNSWLSWAVPHLEICIQRPYMSLRAIFFLLKSYIHKQNLSQSFSLSQYGVLSDCLPVCLFQLASQSSRDVVAWRRYALSTTHRGPFLTKHQFCSISGVWNILELLEVASVTLTTTLRSHKDCYQAKQNEIPWMRTIYEDTFQYLTRVVATL